MYTWMPNVATRPASTMPVLSPTLATPMENSRCILGTCMKEEREEKEEEESALHWMCSWCRFKPSPQFFSYIKLKRSTATPNKVHFGSKVVWCVHTHSGLPTLHPSSVSLINPFTGCKKFRCLNIVTQVHLS